MLWQNDSVVPLPVYLLMANMVEHSCAIDENLLEFGLIPLIVGSR